MKSIFRAVATVTVFSVLTRLLGFVFRVFLSRKIGATGLGLYQMATSVLGIFMTLIVSGLPLTTAKNVSFYTAKNDVITRNKSVTSALVIALMLSILCAIVLLVLKRVWGIVLTDDRVVTIMFILIPSIIFSAIYAIFRGALWGFCDYFSCGLTEFFEQVVRLVLTFIFLHNAKDFFAATRLTAWAFDITCLISAILAAAIYFKRAKLSFGRGEYRKIIKSASPITGIRLANSMVQPLTTLILPTLLIACGYSQAEAVSSFGVVMGMTFPLLFVPMSVVGSISMVLIPTINTMLSKNDTSGIQKNIQNSISVSIFLSALFVPLYLSVGNLIGIVLYDNIMSGVMLQLSSVCVVPITLCNLTGSILNALNLETKSFFNYLFGSIALFVSLLILTPLIGINSIIVSHFISMSLITLLNTRKIKKAVPNLQISIISSSLKYSLIIAPSSLLGHFIANICLHIFTSFFSAFIGGLSAVLCMLILAKYTHLFNFNTLAEMLKKKRKNA